MKTKWIIVLLLAFGFSSPIISQDLHQSDYSYGPLYLNPANAGNFAGTARFGGSYRDQDRVFMQDAYRTAQVFLDVPYALSVRAQDWSGIGIQFYSDQSGNLPLSTQGIILNLSHHLSLDKGQRNILSVGAQYGMIQRRLKDSKVILESDHIDPGVVLTDRNSFVDYNVNYNDLNAGLTFTSKSGNNNLFQIGISAYHLLQTDAQFNTDPNFFPRRYTAHSSFRMAIGKALSLEPQVTFSRSRNTNNIIAGAKSFIELSKKKKSKSEIYFGVGYRVEDALIFLAGMNYKGWNIGMAYDVTISTKSNYNNGQGGLEIGLTRVFELAKKPEVTPVLICPRI